MGVGGANELFWRDFLILWLVEITESWVMQFQFAGFNSLWVIVKKMITLYRKWMGFFNVGFSEKTTLTTHTHTHFQLYFQLTWICEHLYEAEGLLWDLYSIFLSSVTFWCHLMLLNIGDTLSSPVLSSSLLLSSPLILSSHLFSSLLFSSLLFSSLLFSSLLFSSLLFSHQRCAILLIAACMSNAQRAFKTYCVVLIQQNVTEQRFTQLLIDIKADWHSSHSLTH